MTIDQNGHRCTPAARPAARPHHAHHHTPDVVKLERAMSSLAVRRRFHAKEQELTFNLRELARELGTVSRGGSAPASPLTPPWRSLMTPAIFEKAQGGAVDDICVGTHRGPHGGAHGTEQSASAFIMEYNRLANDFLDKSRQTTEHSHTRGTADGCLSGWDLFAPRRMAAFLLDEEPHSATRPPPEPHLRAREMALQEPHSAPPVTAKMPLFRRGPAPPEPGSPRSPSC